MMPPVAAAKTSWMKDELAIWILLTLMWDSDKSLITTSNFLISYSWAPNARTTLMPERFSCMTVVIFPVVFRT